MRENPLVNRQYYHVFNRSIAQYEIYNNAEEYSRMVEILDFYRFAGLPCKYSKFSGLSLRHRKAITNNLMKTNNVIVEIIAYYYADSYPLNLETTDRQWHLQIYG